MKKLTLFFFIFLLFNSKALAQEESLILINQVMIEKKSGAKHEFIELYNPGPEAVSLDGFSLKKKTASGQSSNLISSKNFKGSISSQGYFLISSPDFCQEISCDLEYSSQASLAKNNTLIIYNQSNTVLDKLGWGEASDYHKKPAPNPTKDQALKRQVFNHQSPNNQSDYVLIQESIEVRNSKGKTIKIKIESEAGKKNDFKKVSLKNIKNLQNQEYFEVEGLVSVLPTILGAQYFYIHDQYADDKNIYGLQVYNYYKIFPELKIGDRIKIRGQLSITGQDPFLNYKIKTKEADDIKIISSDNKIPEAPLEKISKLKTEEIGQIKKIKGEISQNKTNQIYLDDGQNEILIDLKKNTNIPRSILKEGQVFTLSGLVREKSKALSLCLLSLDGIEGVESLENNSNDILMPENWSLEKERNKNNFLKYLITLPIALGLLFLFKVVKI